LVEQRGAQLVSGRSDETGLRRAEDGRHGELVARGDGFRGEFRSCAQVPIATRLQLVDDDRRSPRLERHRNPDVPWPSTRHALCGLACDVETVDGRQVSVARERERERVSAAVAVLEVFDALEGE
jgi:hypothetical protein